jgi:hypothetical protein
MDPRLQKVPAMATDATHAALAPLDRSARMIVGAAILVALAFSTAMAVAFEIALDAPMLLPG